MKKDKERICKLVFPHAKLFKVFGKQRSIVLRMRIAVLAKTDERSVLNYFKIVFRRLK